MAMVYREEDADIAVLYGKPIGILGYGTLGRPLAWNLRDSQLDVRIGVRDKDAQYDRAIEDGFPTGLIEDIIPETPIKFVLLPDEIAPQTYYQRIHAHLKRGDTLIFASGYNVAYGFIEPPEFVDVGLLAPRIIADAVRERYLDKRGFHSMVAAAQDATGTVWQTVLALAKAVGSLKAGAVEVTMEQEAQLDLFLQQAIIPSIFHIFTTAAHLLIEQGYPTEAAMMDLYISGEFNEVLARAEQEGLLHAVRQSTATAQFGLVSRLERHHADQQVGRLMETILREIRDGTFAKEWGREYANGSLRLNRLLKAQESLDLWELEQQTIDVLKRKS
jgi:ketol-acid reductoisomerase